MELISGEDFWWFVDERAVGFLYNENFTFFFEPEDWQLLYREVFLLDGIAITSGNIIHISDSIPGITLQKDNSAPVGLFSDQIKKGMVLIDRTPS